MSVSRAQREIDSAEFTDWVAFYELERWGSGVEDLRTGSILSMLANINRDRTKAPDPFSLLEFVPWSSDRLGDRNSEPILLDDPKAQSALLCAALFGGR
jgi:hypothetical protein